jgi:hypothetical protein
MSKGKGEQLFDPLLHAPLNTKTDQITQPFAGFATISSGSLAKTVSTNMVRSGSLIFVTERAPSSLGVAVSSAGHLVVTSIVNNISFNVVGAKGDDTVYDRGFNWFLIQSD